MVQKRPLAIYNGVTKELRIGDTFTSDLLPSSTSALFGDGLEVVLSQLGDGVATTFTLSQESQKVLVFVDGILQNDFIQPDGTDQLVLGFAPSATELITALAIVYVVGSHSLLSGLATSESHPASAIGNTPAGSIISTDVQAAINELDSDILGLTTTVSGIASTATSTANTVSGLVTTVSGISTAITALSESIVTLSTSYITFTYPGDIEVSIGTIRWYPPYDISVLSAQALISTPATGSDILLDVKKDSAASILGASTLSITASASVGNKITITPVELLMADYLTVDITQIGSTTPGSDLSIRISYTQLIN